MLCTGLKRLPGEIDELLLPDAWELFEQWQEWPPEHVLLNGFVGWKHQAIVITEHEVGELTAMLGPAERLTPEMRELVAWAERLKTKPGDLRSE
jgi:hypothetical protein